MRRWFVLSAFVVVLAIVAAEVDQLNGNATLASKCSREESRRVAKFLNSDFLKRMFLKDLQALSISCPLHPSRNIYADQESRKTELRGNDWQCSYCRKRFVSEFYLDRHMTLHHLDHLQLDANPVCLAEFCTLFNCEKYSQSSSVDVSIYEPSYDTRPRDATQKPGLKQFTRLERCSERKAQQLRLECARLSEECFDDLDNRGRIFQTELCDNIVCDARTGILRTGLRTLAQDTAGNSGANNLWQVIRLLLAIVVFAVICIHSMFAEVTIFSILWRALVRTSSSSSSSAQSTGDYLGAFRQQRRQQQQQQHRQQSKYSHRKPDGDFDLRWFFASIAEAFAQGWSDLRQGGGFLAGTSTKKRM